MISTSPMGVLRLPRLSCLLVASFVVLAASRKSSSGDMPVKFIPPVSHGCFHRGAVSFANTLFAVNLYRNVVTVSKGNSIILSPFSISSALAMTYAGSKGKTKTQMSNVLQFNKFPLYCDVNKGYEALLDSFAATKYNHTLKVVNRLFIDRHFRILNGYRFVTKHFYKALALRLPIHRYPEPCRRYINTWVKRRTDFKIVNLLPRGSVFRDTALVLVNAITFKGYWQHEFTEGMTKKKRFYQSRTRWVNMMRMACGAPKLRYAYVQAIRSQVVELPFYNSRIAFYVVLPRRNVRLSYVEKRFLWDPTKLGLKSRKVEVSLPRFTVKKDTKLTSRLKALGMKDLFDKRRANLRGIARGKALWVLDVFHQAYVNVHETGTEASAATAVAVCKSSRARGHKSILFVANRPFLFFIFDRETNSILFNGRFSG